MNSLCVTYYKKCQSTELSDQRTNEKPMPVDYCPMERNEPIVLGGIFNYGPDRRASAKPKVGNVTESDLQKLRKHLLACEEVLREFCGALNFTGKSTPQINRGSGIQYRHVVKNTDYAVAQVSSQSRMGKKEMLEIRIADIVKCIFMCHKNVVQLINREVTCGVSPLSHVTGRAMLVPGICDHVGHVTIPLVAYYLTTEEDHVTYFVRKHDNSNLLQVGRYCQCYVSNVTNESLTFLYSLSGASRAPEDLATLAPGRAHTITHASQ
ncbi:hypothetical protein J6590_034158 [Homalodisca vitripennis]|nr:hypothetical protein J6590_034158 [Homalodisca vitripennis]